MLVGLRWRCTTSAWVERLGMCCLDVELLPLCHGTVINGSPRCWVRSENRDLYNYEG